MSLCQNKTLPISQKVCTKMVKKCSVNTSPIMALVKVLTKVHSYLSNPPDLQKNETFLSKATGKSVES